MARRVGAICPMVSDPHKARKGNAQIARRIRSFHGLMAHIARLARVSSACVTRVVCGQTISERVLRIALRELQRAEASGFERAA